MLRRARGAKTATQNSLLQLKTFAPSRGIMGSMLKTARNMLTLKPTRPRRLREPAAMSAKGRKMEATATFVKGPARKIFPFWNSEAESPERKVAPGAAKI